MIKYPFAINKKKDLTRPLLEISQLYLGSASRERDGAAILVSRLLTRSDTAALLPPYIEWCITQCQNEEGFNVFGILYSLCYICKLAFHDVIQKYHGELWEIVQRAQETYAGNQLAERLTVKLAYRIALAEVRQNSNSCYRIARKQLRDAIQGVTASEEERMTSGVTISEDTEQILSFLIEQLKDKVAVNINERIR